jgi:hypothetical protein
MREIKFRGKLSEIEAKVQAHWADNLKWAIQFYRTGLKKYLKRILLGGFYCEYCRVYNGCFNCPITHVSYKEHCNGTPYQSILNTFDRIYLNYVNNIKTHKTSRKSLVIRIWKEYKFLKKTYKG